MERVEFFLVFPGQHREGAAGEAVFDVVEAGGGFSGFGGGSGREMGVGLIRGDLGISGHGRFLLFVNERNGHQTPCALC